MVIMGFWTYAEMTIGLVVSCLPVMPRFFHHIGPKFSKVCSFRLMRSRDITKKGTFIGRFCPHPFKGPNDTVKGLIAQAKREVTNSLQYRCNMILPQIPVLSRWSAILDSDIGTRREDLELGKNNAGLPGQLASHIHQDFQS